MTNQLTKALDILEDIIDILVDLDYSHEYVASQIPGFEDSGLFDKSPEIFLKHPLDFLKIVGVEKDSKIGQKLLFLHFRYQIHDKK